MGKDLQPIDWLEANLKVWHIGKVYTPIDWFLCHQAAHAVDVEQGG